MNSRSGDATKPLSTSCHQTFVHAKAIFNGRGTISPFCIVHTIMRINLSILISNIRSIPMTHMETDHYHTATLPPIPIATSSPSSHRPHHEPPIASAASPSPSARHLDAILTIDCRSHQPRHLAQMPSQSRRSSTVPRHHPIDLGTLTVEPWGRSLGLLAPRHLGHRTCSFAGGEAEAKLLLHSHTWRGRARRGTSQPHSGREGVENGWCIDVIYFCVAWVPRQRMGVAFEYSIGNDSCCLNILLETILAATVAFGDPILRFEVSVGDSLTPGAMDFCKCRKV
jgi:hypothetical protein